MASPASIDPARNAAPDAAVVPSTKLVSHSADKPAQILTAALVARQGRVVTRTELAREIGLRTDQTRRVDAMLVEVRRDLTAQGYELINVRSRGWMIGSTNP